MSEENKKRTAVWLSPRLIRRMDSWLEEDNCSTRSEFIEKALRFYMGYLATEDTSEYLSRALVDTLRGTLAVDRGQVLAGPDGQFIPRGRSVL